MKWKAGDETVERGYQFSYDNLSRLSNASYAEGASLTTNLNRFNEIITYNDKMGNIKTLQRQGKLDSGYGVMDNLTYTYSGNKLTKVTDAASPSITYANAFHFIDRANADNEYTYDTNGNLTKDLNKNITSITYNTLNLPSVITFADGNTITYGYDGEGSKLSVAYTTGGTTTKTEYVGNKVYKNGTLSMIVTEEGYATLSGSTPTYYYYLKDHQGNNRVVINQGGTVQQVNHYYPFGGLFGEGIQTANQPYKYNGKELDRFQNLDMYDYGARHYDAAIGRWSAVDPMAEKYYSLSPYVYVANNPINAIDLRGDSVTILNMGNGTNQHMAMLVQNDEGKWQYYSLNGEWVYKLTDGTMGGKPYHDTGEKTFFSPQEFLQSKYNIGGNKKQIDNNIINNYAFTESYVLPTTSEQDYAIRETFLNSAKEGYSLIGNQCSQAIQKSLNAAGIETRELKFFPYDSQTMTGTFVRYNPYLPSSAFNAIIKNNPNGQLIKRKRQ